MKLNYNCKKLFTVIVLFLLAIGLVFPPNISAKFNISNEDGVAFDDFENDDSVTLQNCTLDTKTNSITLSYEPLNLTYNYEEKPENIEAWKITDTLITPGEGDFLQLLSKFINPNLIPGSEFNSQEYTAIKYMDEGKIVETSSVWWRYLNYTSSPMNLFRFKIDEDVDLIDKFWVGWQSGNYEPTANVQKISMYIWSYGDNIPRWNLIHSIKYDENVTYPRGFIGEEVSSQRYVSEEGGVDILIVGTPTNGTGNVHQSKLISDYVEIKLGIEEGYNPNGIVFSDSVTPQTSRFKGWESVFWEGSEQNNKIDIKIHILDKDNNLIDSLNGNSNGFSTSPIDLSSLGVNYKAIKLKALLHSESPQYTPVLKSWGVLWRTIDGFYDNFTYNYRISDTLGVNIENNQVKLSKFYSEWPLFGKNPSNTRSYAGSDPDESDNVTFWTTDIDKDYGGWFRSPVMSDGLVYIGSDDERIYAFNLINDSDNKIQSPSFYSGVNHYVESSVAIGENSQKEKLVIVATSKNDTKFNYVAALKAADLSTEWSTHFYNDLTSPICFSSSPTIANDRVYVTSWSGRFANIPQLYYFYSRLNTILNNALGLNNYLYAFDIEDGEISEGYPISLPAGSLSTPAIDDGIIFVGCENIKGPSLLAFEENSGKLIWNVSVGMIGRSSPVIADSQNGKIVIVLSREQSVLSFSGEDKVFALSAETGEMLWNKTLGNESTLIRTTLLKGLDFKNLIATSEPASTPAVSGDTVFIMAPNGTLFALDVETGEEIWRFNIKKSFGGILSTYYCSSPAVVGNTVYISSENGHVYAINADDGKLIIEYPIVFSGIKFQLLLYFYSSPIVTDGVVIASATELLPIGSENIGHLICLGNYSVNNVGEIYSTPIHVQSGKWWNKFNAKVTTNPDNKSKITFSILDGEGNIIMSNLNGKNIDISDSNIFNTGIIQLYAKLETTNDTPILESWSVTFETEENPPVFAENTFSPDPNGWINSNKPVCTIEARDIHPGLDVSSAKYRLVYKDNKKSDWYDAECTGENGTKINQIITADVTQVEPTSQLKRIEISIEDLSGNKAIFELAKDFKLDTETPISYLESSLLSKYNEPFRIIANATDYGENVSGVKTITLYYKLQGQENWTQYGLSESPYEWDFDTEISGLYEISTIAKDRAGNTEEFPDETKNSFIFDKILPAKPDLEDSYQFATLPKLSITFLDDYLLKDVEYRLNFRGDWIKINEEDINSNSYKGEWTLEELDWEYIEEDTDYFIYFRITDAAGNIYQTIRDQDALKIKKDTIPPGTSVEIDLSDLKGGGWKEKYKISAYIPVDEDIGYVTLEYRYSPNNDNWGNWKQYGKSLNSTTYGSIYEWEFNADEGSGYYEFKVKVWDYAGNYVESIPEKVSLTILNLSLLAILIVLFIVLIIFTRIITVKMIKKRD
ncbi:MAG: hypothetical protein AYK22_00595 [Thermoplasmatales archaeon SG8-52-3]|nr:MAG: hypothetical protein AYK22_00595 [Thermoplasmatales archaeon SG8-52-3]